ncbi:MAG: toxin-antitoxin system YwqK family antitoxin [Chlamydiales bacterium]|nr:toxin-antitoxin system YwqK family antitoxin [Chlamydiales bacterium]
MKQFSLLAICSLGLLLNGCQMQYGCCPTDEPALACINLIDKEGTAITIQSEERLRQYACADFLSPQPYDKVLRIYKKDSTGNSRAYVTSYHENGQPKQYLEIRNAGAYGSYKEWHENGILRLEGTIVGGTADITQEAQKSWKFDGVCKVWDDCEHLIAEYSYDKGALEGFGKQFYPDGQVRMRTPYCRNLSHGFEEMFYPDGRLMASAHWVKGELRGEALRYWPSGELALKEEYDHIQLIAGQYYDPSGKLVSEITLGNGYRAVFDQESVKELHQYQNGLAEGEVKVLDSKGNIASVYHVKNGLKNGEEVVFFPPRLGVNGKDVSNLQPHLLIGWREGKIHGVTKTWYQNGVIESQREMADNRRNGVALAWYRDGSMMLMEEYDHNKLMKGEYYKRGERLPDSLIMDGNGVATLFDSDGQFLRRIEYYHGNVID